MFHRFRNFSRFYSTDLKPPTLLYENNNKFLIQISTLAVGAQMLFWFQLVQLTYEAPPAPEDTTFLGSKFLGQRGVFLGSLCAGAIFPSLLFYAAKTKIKRVALYDNKVVSITNYLPLRGTDFYALSEIKSNLPVIAGRENAIRLVWGKKDFFLDGGPDQFKHPDLFNATFFRNI